MSEPKCRCKHLLSSHDTDWDASGCMVAMCTCRDFHEWSGVEPNLDFSRDVGPGWLPLLEDLTRKLATLGWDGQILQVKEKFGRLRFYWKNNIQGEDLRAIAQDVVNYAEHRSGYICEACGAAAEIRTNGRWLKAECLPCHEKRLARG